MSKKATFEYWVKNRTAHDLPSSELQLKIPANKIVNLAHVQPALTHEMLQKSEAEGGFLYNAFLAQKLVKLQMAPAKPKISTPKLTESMKPIPSRVKASVVMNLAEKDFIEELSRFGDDIGGERYSDGFADPSVVMGESGERFDGKPFSAISIPIQDTEQVIETLPPGSHVRLKAKTMPYRGADVVVMDSPDSEEAEG